LGQGCCIINSRVLEMAEKLTSRNVNAKEAVEAIRGELSNVELMEQFRISPKGFADLLTQLFEKRLITEEDLAGRGIRFRVVKKKAIPDAMPSATPHPIEHDEEFLDTVELTELLASKPPELSSAPKEVKPPPAPRPHVDEAPKPPAKKARFSLSSLFKKDK